MNDKLLPKISLVEFTEPNNRVTGRYLSGVLLSKGYKTDIISIILSKRLGSSGLSWDYEEYYLQNATIKNLIEITMGSLFIGFTVYTFDAHIMRTIYSYFNGPDRPPIVVGGPHPTLDPYDSSLFSDFVCIGDGERGLVELADKLSNNSVSLRQHNSKEISENIFSSLWLRNDIKEDLPISLEAPVDSQTFPDYSFESEFLLEEDNITEINIENAYHYIKTYSTFYSRGCINNCAFCAHKALAIKSGFQKRVKSKDPTHFINELSDIKSKLPWVTKVTFFDSNILSNKKAYLKNILLEYKNSVSLPLSVTGFTFNNVDESILRAFLETGMNYVIFGLQSGAEKTKKLLNRKEKISKVLEIDLLLHQLKREYAFNVQYDIILDIPWETQEEVFESINFIVNLCGYDYLDIFSLRFLPGTELFNKALEEGIINIDSLQEEYKRAYRGISYKYENFVFILIRDIPFFRKILAKKLTSSYITHFMNKLFKQHGIKIFRIYYSVFFKIFDNLRKLRSFNRRIAVHGPRAALRHLLFRLKG
jgi:radical SAM superfamily enzyme YgiQ (UPF0313 family)